MDEGAKIRMNAAQARAAFFQRKLKIEPVTVSLPGLEELDGQLAVMEVSAKDIVDADKMSAVGDGEKDESLQMATMIAKSLVLTDTKERLFSDTDIGGIAQFGLTVLSPLSQLAARISGLDPDSLAQAKKNLMPTASSISATSSPENLVEVSPETNA